MSFSRKAAFALPTFVLLLCSLLFAPCEARADAIVITSGSYTASSPFLFPPSFITWGASFQGDNFAASAGAGDGQKQGVSHNCPFPCVAGSAISVTTTTGLFADSPAAGHLQINGQNYNGWFFGTNIMFSADAVTIPLNAGALVTLTTQFTMDGTIGFTAYDLQTGVVTPNIFSSQVFGSGIASIDLAFVQSLRGYEVRSVRYDFQSAAVPEPATLLLLGTGLAGVAARHRRRKGRIKEEK